MEVGSSSLAVSASSGSSDPLRGLKFGEKTYFGDLGNGGRSSSTSSLAATAAVAGAVAGSGSTPARKGKKQGEMQPARCQVEGCNVDLSDAKAYYYRHKVCGMHSKSPKVIVAGLEQRFCQQCSRFHPLPEFDQVKRSCRRRLAGHNERRRKLSMGSFHSRSTMRFSSRFHGEHSRPCGSAIDFGYPRLFGTYTSSIWPQSVGRQWQESFSNTHAYMPQNTAPTSALSLLSSQPSYINGNYMHLTMILSDSTGPNTSSFRGHEDSSGGVNGCCGGSSSSLDLVEFDPARAFENSGSGVHWSI